MSAKIGATQKKYLDQVLFTARDPRHLSLYPIAYPGLAVDSHASIFQAGMCYCSVLDAW